MALSTSPDILRTLAPIEIELVVDIDYYNGEFSYRYSTSELVLAKGQQIVIVLKKQRTPPNATVHIVGFSCTHPTKLNLVEPKDGSGNPIPGNGKFPDRTERMLLTLDSEFREMVNFGTHVFCKFNYAHGNDEYTKLCDPQIGNGPP
jgi:hypothetical protein